MRKLKMFLILTMFLSGGLVFGFNNVKAQEIDTVNYSNKNLAVPNLEYKEYLGDGDYRLYNANGVTIDYNVYNGIISINGTATTVIEYDFSDVFETLSPTNIYSYYRVSGSISNTTLSIFTAPYNENNVMTITPQNQYKDNFKVLSFELTRIWLYLSPGGRFNNLKFKLQLEKGDTATPYTISYGALEQHSHFEYQNGFNDGKMFLYDTSKIRTIYHQDVVGSDYFETFLETDLFNGNDYYYFLSFGYIFNNFNDLFDVDTVYYQFDRFVTISQRFNYEEILLNINIGDILILDNKNGNKMVYVQTINQYLNFGLFEYKESFDFKKNSGEYNLRTYKITDYQDGYNNGYESGKNDGYNQTKDLVYDLAYQDGYKDGLNNQHNNVMGVILGGMFGFIGAIGNLEILPGFKLFYVVGVIVVFGLIAFLTNRRK